MSEQNKDTQKIKTIDGAHVFDAYKKSFATEDGFDNFVSRLGLNNDNALSAGTYEFNYITRNRLLLEAAYRGSWVVGALIDYPAEDMTRAGIDITTNDDFEIKKIKRQMSKLKIWSSYCDLIKWGNLYGAGVAVLQIEGQDLSTPLDIETVGLGQFKGLVVYDRWQLNPVMMDLIDVGPDMGLPKYYQIVNNPTQGDPMAETMTGQIKVHHSRCIRFIGIKLPYFQAITEMMWGESKLERMWDRLIAFDNATMSSAQLVDKANLRTVGIENLREIIAAGGEAQKGLEAMFEMMRTMQVNEGLTLLDKNDSFATTAYSFAGLSDMMLQFAQQLSGSSKIPLIRLLGQSPAGLNSSGDADLRMYYDNINAEQEAKIRDGIDLILRVLWRSTFGQSAPDDLEFKFTPLWQMSATDKANMAKTQTDTIMEPFTAGITSRVSALKELRQMSGDTGLFSNISDEEISEAESEPPPLPETVTEQDQIPPLPETGLREMPIKVKDQKNTIHEKIKAWLKRH